MYPHHDHNILLFSSVNALSPEGKVTIFIAGGTSNVEIGEQLQMTCSAASTGPGNIVIWRRSGQELESGTGTLTISTTSDDTVPSVSSDLIISSVDTQTAGIYNCEVTNDSGNDFATTTIIGEICYNIIVKKTLRYQQNN